MVSIFCKHGEIVLRCHNWLKKDQDNKKNQRFHCDKLLKRSGKYLRPWAISKR